MRIFYIIVYSILLFCNKIYGQDDLLGILEKEMQNEANNDFVFATFKASRIINGQSIEVPAGGVLNFVIAHRFGKINDGPYNFFGLDQATMRLGFEYGLSNRFEIGIGRSSFQKTYDTFFKYKLIRQSSGSNKTPVSMAFFSGISINSLKWSEPDRVNYFTSRMSYYHQLLIARKISNVLSLQVMPSLVHRNLVSSEEDQNDVYAIGLAVRYKLTNRLSVNGEYFYQLPGYNASNTFNSLAVGLDIETGGHVFSVHITNSQGMIENYFIAQTDGDITKGDIYFGFNINRVFTIVKKK